MSNTARVQAMLRNWVRRANGRPGHNLSIGVRERRELQPVQDCTVCPCRKSDPRDPSRTDPTSRPSRTVQDRTCAVQGIQFHHGIPPYTFIMVSGRPTYHLATVAAQVNTYQTFSTIVAPAGMKYPLYTSSSAARFGIAMGVGQPHRSNSLISAEMYGRSS